MRFPVYIQSTRRKAFWIVLLLYWIQKAAPRTPLYPLLNDVGRPSFSSSISRSGFSPMLHSSISRNTLDNTLRRSRYPGRWSLLRSSSPARPGRSLIPRRIYFPFLDDVLEPLETLWEFYVKRDEIFWELVDKGVEFTKRSSVRALGFLVVSFSIAELLARVGILGDKGEGIWDFFRESDVVQDAAEEKVYQRTAGFLTDTAVKTFRRYRRWNTKSKFAIALSAGALFSQAMVSMAVLSVKFGLVAFMVLETLAFAGVIGEPGETIGDWIDDHRNDNSVWQQRAKGFNEWMRKHVSFEGLEEFYEVAVDEEKVAATGFAIGSVMAMFT